MGPFHGQTSCQLKFKQAASRNFFQNFSRSFRKFFASFRKFFEGFGLALTCWDLLGSARMHSDASGCVRMRPDAFGKNSENLIRKSVFCSFRTCSDLFGRVQMHSDAFGCIRMHLDAFGCVRTLSETFEKHLTKKSFFGIFGRFLRKHAKTDVTSSFLDIFCSR